MGAFLGAEWWSGVHVACTLSVRSDWVRPGFEDELTDGRAEPTKSGGGAF